MAVYAILKQQLKEQINLLIAEMFTVPVFRYDKVNIFDSNLKSDKHEVFSDFSCFFSRLHRGCQ